MNPTHKSVLLKESLDLLNLEEGDQYLDATLGQGGHAEEVFLRLGKRIKIAGIDADIDAVNFSKQRLEKLGANPKFMVLNFRDIEKSIEALQIDTPNKILYDLGWNRNQFDSELGEEGRGFSFMKDEPLVMTFSKDAKDSEFTAYDIVNSWEEKSIATIIESYGEEKFGKKIAKAIVEAREQGKIKTTFELVEIIKKATPFWYHFKKIHPATRTFQALRITVNDELQALETSLNKSFEILKQQGRIAVISFHSLEDRIVKRFFKSLEESGQVKILTKKPISPTEDEIKENPRSRSAKLRAIIKL